MFIPQEEQSMTLKDIHIIIITVHLGGGGRPGNEATYLDLTPVKTSSILPLKQDGGGRPGNEATYLDLTPVKTSSILPLKCFALG